MPSSSRRGAFAVALLANLVACSASSKARAPEVQVEVPTAPETAAERSAPAPGWPGDWGFCPLRSADGTASEGQGQVDPTEECEKTETELTACAGSAAVGVALLRCCTAKPDDYGALCSNELVIGESRFALATEDIDGNDVEGAFEFYSNELTAVTLSPGVQAVARRYYYGNIGGARRTTLVVYAWDGVEIAPLLERTLSVEQGDELHYEERVTFAARPAAIADAVIEISDFGDEHEEPSQSRQTLRFQDGRYAPLVAP